MENSSSRVSNVLIYRNSVRIVDEDCAKVKVIRFLERYLSEKAFLTEHLIGGEGTSFDAQKQYLEAFIKE